MNLSENVELDLGLRAVDDLPRPAVPGYIAVDARLGWHITDALELSLAGFNLFDSHHPETGNEATRKAERRSVYVGDRKNVVSGKSVLVRVDLGGRRILKQKNSQHNNQQHNRTSTNPK